MVKKRLLSFAHFGEAQFFLSDPNLAFKKSSSYDFFFEGNGVDLILTGEGIFQTLFRLTQILTQASYRNGYQDCLNIGIAGSIAPHLKKYDLAQIRTVYFLQGKSFEFHTFTSSSAKLSSTILYDVVTSQDRIIEQQIKSDISGFGDMVDRELWAIAYVCHQFNLPWDSYKIISDEFDSKTHCRLIFDEKDTFAKALHEKLSSQILQSQRVDLTSKSATELEQHQLGWVEELLNNTELHWTHSLKADFNKVVKLLSADSLPMAQANIQQILANSKLSPKVKVMKIIHELRALTNPLMAEYRKQRQALVDTWARRGIMIQFDPQGENLELQFRFTASTQQGLKKKVESLNQFIEIENLDRL